jgi:hypothetical protein
VCREICVMLEPPSGCGRDHQVLSPESALCVDTMDRVIAVKGMEACVLAICRPWEVPAGALAETQQGRIPFADNEDGRSDRNELVDGPLNSADKLLVSVESRIQSLNQSICYR